MGGDPRTALEGYETSILNKEIVLERSTGTEIEPPDAKAPGEPLKALVEAVESPWKLMGGSWLGDSWELLGTPRPAGRLPKHANYIREELTGPDWRTGPLLTAYTPLAEHFPCGFLDLSRHPAAIYMLLLVQRLHD